MSFTATSSIAYAPNFTEGHEPSWGLWTLNATSISSTVQFSYGCSSIYNCQQKSHTVEVFSLPNRCQNSEFTKILDQSLTPSLSVPSPPFPTLPPFSVPWVLVASWWASCEDYLRHYTKWRTITAPFLKHPCATTFQKYTKVSEHLEWDN